MQGYINKKAFNPYRATVRDRSFELICPNTTTLPTQGHYGSDDIFEYVEIMIRRCQTDDLKDEPPDDDEDGRP